MILELDLSSLRQAVGGGSYVRGADYARQQAVSSPRWEPADSALHGVVRGHGGHVYQVTAFFSLDAGRPARFTMGECSCPVEFNCKHVVALVLSALTPDSPGSAGPPSPQPPLWQQSLDSLLSPGGRLRSGMVPLAIEFALAAAPGQAPRTGQPPLRLTTRLVRPGKSAGWVAGDLRWDRLGALSYRGDYNEQQVRLLRDLYGLYQASAVHSGYYGYHYGDGKSIDFSSVGSRLLWPLLEEARAVGLQLVYPGKGGPLAGYTEAGFCLDVTRDQAGDLQIVPVIRLATGNLPCRSPSSGPRGMVRSTSTAPRRWRAAAPGAGGSGWPGSPGRCRRRCSSWRLRASS